MLRIYSYLFVGFISLLHQEKYKSFTVGVNTLIIYTIKVKRNGILNFRKILDCDITYQSYRVYMKCLYLGYTMGISEHSVALYDTLRIYSFL